MSHIHTLPSNELSFLASVLEKDAKNYHVWSYRQWLVRHFSLWDTELPYIEQLLEEDVRNNSAWNHRWFIVFGHDERSEREIASNQGAQPVVSPEVVEREIDYASAAIAKAPQNQSPWLYLRGVLRRTGRSITELKSFAEKFADLGKVDEVRSSHALDFLADVYAEEKDKARSSKALDLLATKYDPIRKNYWDYRKSQLETESVSG